MHESPPPLSQPANFFACVCVCCTPWMLSICPSFNAAPLTLHRVLTMRSALASDRKGLEAKTPFLLSPSGAQSRGQQKKKSSKCIFPCLIMCIIYQCAEDCRLNRNYCNKFVTSGLTFQLFRTMKGGYILPKLCCYGKLHPHTVLSRFSLWLHFNSSS